MPDKLKIIRDPRSGGLTINFASEHAKMQSALAETGDVDDQIPPEGSDDETDELCLHLAGDSSDEERQIAGAAMFLSQDQAFDALMRCGPGTNQGIRRYLDPGRPIQLWWQYAAVAKQHGSRVASYSSFMRVFHLVFDKIGFLKFRKKRGEHAACTACEGYKKELKEAYTMTQRDAIMTVFLCSLWCCPVIFLKLPVR